MSKTISLIDRKNHVLVPTDKIVIMTAKPSKKRWENLLVIELINGRKLNFGFENEEGMEKEYTRIMGIIEGWISK